MKVYQMFGLAAILTCILAVIKIVFVKTMSIWIVFSPLFLALAIFIILFVVSIYLLIRQEIRDAKADYLP